MPYSWRALLRNGRQEIGGRSVVPEGLTDVHVQIDIAGTEDEATTQLKGIPAQPMLSISNRTGSCSCY